MAMKRFFICFIFLVICISQLNGQERKDQSVKKIPLPDSTLIDSLNVVFSESKEDSLAQIMPIEELEDYIISLQDTFFNYDYKSFDIDEYYTFGNAHYVLPDNRREFSLKNVRLNSISIPKWQLNSLLDYFDSDVTSNVIQLRPLHTSFRALLTDVQYSNGDYNKEKKYIGFMKNDFLNLADFQLFAHSGEYQSPWGKKCYYDDFVVNLHSLERRTVPAFFQLPM